MELLNNIQLAYCTNVHRGSTWDETFESLEKYVLEVKKLICPERRFAIGLRLGAEAARSLSDLKKINLFKKWLDRNNCYVFTINGFPYGNFHGTRVKEQVYRPDWTDSNRLAYTIQLFKILEKLLEKDEEGSVSTLPASFKEFHPSGKIPAIAFENIVKCADEIERISKAKKLDLHLGLEPEPLGSFETTAETITFFNELDNFSTLSNLKNLIGVNYDCCHLAVEFESAQSGLNKLKEAGIRLSKIHLSSALRAKPTDQNKELLNSFVEDVYLHQVIIGKENKIIKRYKDLDLALNDQSMESLGDEWRIHYHVPLHASPCKPLEDTRNQVIDTINWIGNNPGACRHLEMETYTWEVLPKELQSESVVKQVAKEYEWTLQQLKEQGLYN